MMSSSTRRVGLRLCHNGKGRPPIFSCSARQLSTQNFRRGLASHEVPNLSHPYIQIWRKSAALQRPSIRYASTTTTTAPATPTVDTVFNTPPQAPLTTTSVDDWTTAIEALDSKNLLGITEQIGYLKALGLDFGWGPTACIEYILEHVHIYSGTPWWASIMLTAVLVRLSILKLFINASDQAGRLAQASPRMKPLQEAVTAAKTAQDTSAMMLASQNLRAVMKEEGVSYVKMFGPFLQIFLGYGTFRLMKAMAALPVPGLDQGGFLWLMNLTIPDPYYVLPVLTSVTMFYTFKQGGETGVSNPTAMAGSVRNFLLYGFPALSFIFMMWFPACLQLTFATTGLLGFGSSTLLRNPTVRNYFSITPLPRKRDPSTSPGTYRGVMNIYQPPVPNADLERSKGVIGGAVADIKGAASQVLKRAKEAQASKDPKRRLTPGEIRRAKVYEERRKREIEEEKLEREMKRRERRQR